MRHLPYNTFLVFTGIVTSGIDMQSILLVLSGNLLIGFEQYEWLRKPIISICCVLFDVKSGFCSAGLSHFIQIVTGYKMQDRSEFSVALESAGSIQKSTGRVLSGYGA